MKHLIRLGICALLSAVQPAAAATLTAGNGSQITFTARQSEVPVVGEFKSFAGTIDFDPTRPEAGKASISIDLASLSTGSDDADTLIKGRDFFDVAHYPRATFVANRFSHDPSGHYQVYGQLQLKGHGGALAVPFTARSAADGLWLEGSVPLSRLAYKVGQGEWSDTGSLDDAVQVAFRLHLPR